MHDLYEELNFDVVVIGGGSAGTTAAIEASVLPVERA